MNNLKLFADRISHPSRFCIQFLKMNQIPFEEIKVSLLFGENANHPELPLKQIPVLQLSVENDQRCQVPMTIVQSTTILKYLSDKAGPTQIEDKWYPKNLEARAHVDEFVDFWHSSMNSALVTTIRNKLFYKLLFKRQTPDHGVINANFDMYLKSVSHMEKYFLKEKDFIGGHDLNICDLIATATLEQSMLAGYESSPAIKEYLNRCGEKIPQYHEILKELKATPGLVKKLEAKFNL